MRIRTDISNLNAQRHLQASNRLLSAAMQRLSTGKRVNFAKDDASGLSIANGLNAQSRAYVRAIRNINDSIYFLRTADGVISSQIEIVQRMRELTLNAANGTIAATEREFLHTELTQLMEEFERVSQQTKFNDSFLLDGSFEDFSLLLGQARSDKIEVSLPTLNPSDVFKKEVGTGRFQEEEAYTSTLASVRSESADLNGDDILDIVTVDSTNKNIKIFLGQKDGSLEEQAAITRSENIRDLALGDYDNDGDVDIVIANQTSASLSVFLNDGHSSYSAADDLRLDTAARSINFGDLNGDGILDILATSTGTLLNSRLTSFLGLGNGNYQNRITQTYGASFSHNPLKLQDVNGDGKDDIISTHGSLFPSPAMIAASNGDGTFSSLGSFPMAHGFSVSDFVFTDFDNNGSTDIILAGGSRFELFRNNGSGSFTSAGSVPTGIAAVTNIQIADLNNDGIGDIIASSSTEYSVSLANGSGENYFSPYVQASAGLKQFHVSDYDSNGVNDLISTSSSGLQIYASISSQRSADDEVDITTQESARNSLQILDNALNKLLQDRSRLGAVENRLQSSLQANNVLLENLSKAKSQIQDLDYAIEIAELTRLQVLEQAQVVSLGQSAISLQAVLRLI